MKSQFPVWMPLAFAAGFPFLIFGCVMLVFFMRSGIGDSGQGVDFAYSE